MSSRDRQTIRLDTLSRRIATAARQVEREIRAERSRPRRRRFRSRDLNAWRSRRALYLTETLRIEIEPEAARGAS